MLEGEAMAGDPPQPVLPDGRPELVLHFGDPFRLVSAAGQDLRQPSIIFAGQLNSQLLLQPSSRFALVGIRFHPHGAAGLLRIPQHELAGIPAGLDVLDQNLRKALSSIQFDGDLHRAAITTQRILASRIARDRIDPRVAYAVRLIAQSGGRLPIDGVARAAGVTRRHLERRFLDHVGLTPKRLARITRFQRALHLLEYGDGLAGADAAAACGYADQPHFIRDFRALAGCPPSGHLLRRAELTGFFIASSA